jgi:hypothetical protein
MKPTVEKISGRHYSVDTSRDISPVIEWIVEEVEGEQMQPRRRGGSRTRRHASIG